MAIPVINLSRLDGSNGFRMDGEADSLWSWTGKRGDHSGYSVSGAGDVNGDGYDDVIIGAPHANTNSRYGDGLPLGSSYVVFGKASGFSAEIALSSLDGSNGFRLDGGSDHYLELSGSSVSNAGDVNGDGYGDLIIGAPRTFSYEGAHSTGFGYVVLGKASGFSAALDLSSLDGNNGYRFGGPYESHFGASVSSLGDIDGDGFDDVIFGAPVFINTMGAGFVVFGKASELSLSQNGNNNFAIVGDEGGNIGSSVSGAGDINGDGFDDVIVGAREITSYVIFGKASGFNDWLYLSSLDGSNGFRVISESGHNLVSDAGDVNGDGIDDLIVGNSVIFGRTSGFGASLDVANLDGNTGFRVNGSDGPISSAGDVNGDGIDDVIAGGADVKGDGSGSSYVVFGKTSGFGAVLDLVNLDENAGFRLDGAAAGDKSGFSVSGAGDVNSDGFDDLIVGAPEASPNGITQAGSSYVIFGRSDFGGGNVIEGTPGDDVLKGTPAADIFEAGDGSDLMIGRGGADIFKAGAGNDKITVTDLDFASVVGGTGNDVLHLAGNGLNLDLADFGDDISGIETFCLFGKGDNTLTLTAEGLLNLSDTSNTLKVNGNAAGHIIVEDSGWVDGGSRGSGYYHVYTNDEAVLLVGQNITIDFAIV